MPRRQHMIKYVAYPCVRYEYESVGSVCVCARWSAVAKRPDHKLVKLLSFANLGIISSSFFLPCFAPVIFISEYLKCDFQCSVCYRLEISPYTFFFFASSSNICTYNNNIIIITFSFFLFYIAWNGIQHAIGSLGLCAFLQTEDKNEVYWKEKLRWGIYKITYVCMLYRIIYFKIGLQSEIHGMASHGLDRNAVDHLYLINAFLHMFLFMPCGCKIDVETFTSTSTVQYVIRSCHVWIEMVFVCLETFDDREKRAVKESFCC